ncbi:hypothetical protein [Campylobacter sp. 7477a]|uniref:hypothetical protein n=1 Tax=Campylobacter sp. 7477a TaxID=2735741 RepID=UPI00301464AD|nr:hypothetical protein [Campylobacter sp. 7477a]
MKIAFAKVANQNIDFEIKSEELNFKGHLKRIDHKNVKCLGNISGSTAHNCDRCGADISLDINENVGLIVSDGVYTDPENELSDAIEFFDHQIYLEEILKSEIEAFKSDYFYCKDCKNL